MTTRRQDLLLEEGELAGGVVRGLRGLQQRLDLFLETLYVFEVSIHACVPDVCDPVQLLEALHHHLTDGFRRHLGPARIRQSRLNILNQLVDTTHLQRTLGAGLRNTCPELVALELLAPPVSLDQHDYPGLYSLVGCVSAGALKTLAPSPNTVAGVPRVNDLRVVVITVWTVHITA